MSIEKSFERIADALEHLCAVADHVLAMNQNALTKSLQNDTPAEQAAPVVEKKPRSKKAAPAPAAEPVAEVLSAPAPEPEPAHGAMTLDECNAQLREIVLAKNNGSAIMDLLGKYAPATRSLRDIDPVHYPEIVDRAKEL